MPATVRRDLGPWSPGGRFAEYRRRMDALIDSLIADARADPDFHGAQRRAVVAVAGPLRKR